MSVDQKRKMLSSTSFERGRRGNIQRFSRPEKATVNEATMDDYTVLNESKKWYERKEICRSFITPKRENFLQLNSGQLLINS